MKKKTFAKKYGTALIVIVGLVLIVLLVGTLIRSVQVSDNGNTSLDEGSDSFGEFVAPLEEVHQITGLVGDRLEDNSLIVGFSISSDSNQENQQQGEENVENLEDHIVQIISSEEMEVVRLKPDKSYEIVSWDDIDIGDSISIYSDTNLMGTGGTIPIEVSYVTILSQ
jgi:flagellar basal body-associated protein FliL